MTAEHFQAPDAPGFKLDPRVVGAFGRFAGGYWQGATRLNAWLLTLALAACLILSTAATVALNHWNRWFFDSLEARDVEAITQAVFVFALIIAAMAAIGVGIVLSRETLQVRWRAWLVHQLVDRWLGRQRFYHMNVSGKEPPNPEYRISDDTRWATEPLVDLGIGLLLAVVGAAAFISILWTVGGSITFDAGFTGPITIPAYMVWVALAYGVIASGLMLWVGAPLVGFVGRKNEAEGYFRFAMMRIRDNAESVALMNGAALRAGHPRPLLRHRGGALDGHRAAARPPDLDHQLRRADEPDHAPAVRARRSTSPATSRSARSRSWPPPSSGADRHLLGGRQLQPRRRVVRLAPGASWTSSTPATRSMPRRRRCRAAQPTDARAAQRAPRPISRSPTAPAVRCCGATELSPQPGEIGARVGRFQHRQVDAGARAHRPVAERARQPGHAGQRRR